MLFLDSGWLSKGAGRGRLNHQHAGRQYIEPVDRADDPDERELIERWIRAHPDYDDPADAVLTGSQAPKYAIVGEMGVPGAGVASVADGFEVPNEAVEAAMAYYRRHRALIDARLFTGSGGDSRDAASAVRP